MTDRAYTEFTYGRNLGDRPQGANRHTQSNHTLLLSGSFIRQFGIFPGLSVNSRSSKGQGHVNRV